MTSPIKNNAMTVGFVALVTLLSCSALRIKRSGVAGYDDPYGLTNALGLMERTQRANFGDFLNRRIPDEEEAYFNPNTGLEYELSPMEYLSALGYGKESLPEYAYREQLPPYPYGEVPIVLDDVDPMGFGPKKRTAYNPRRVVPTLDELKTIFGEADVPMKRLAPIKRRQPEQSMETQDERVSDKVDKSERSKQWRNLISAAQKLNGMDMESDENDEHNDVDEDVINDKLAKDASLQDELQDAFSDAEVDDDSEANDEVNELETDNDQPLSKSKRASSGVGDTSDYILALLKEITDLKEKVSVLEMKQLLEDRENDFLANALKYSTLDQMSQDGEYVDKEYSDIAKATKIEELLQEFSEAVEVDNDDDGDDDEDDEVYAEEGDGFNPEGMLLDETIKRSDDKNSIKETDGEWLEEPVDLANTPYIEGDVSDGNDLNDNIFESDGIDDNTGNDVMNDVIVDDEVEHIDPEDDESTLLLTKLLNNLSPDTVQDILSELEEKERNVDTDNEMCPAVLELSQNCAFADEHNIPMDDEARNLCIRHQLCYTCGEALGISATSCDGGYKGTAIAECEGDLSCVKSAAYFLRLMTSQYHMYNTYSPEICLNSCVKDFIYGVA